MTRKINFADLQAAVDEAYEKFRSDDNGTVDVHIEGVDADTFGISVVLADGTMISKGAAKTAVPMGNIIGIPVHTVLLTQNSTDELAKKSGKCPCSWTGGQKPAKPQTSFCAHGLRAISAVAPQNDPEGKWDIMSNMLTSLMGSPAELDDKLYQKLGQEAVSENVENALADAGYTLYDDAPIAINLYTKAAAMKATAEQLATMGATIAADGVNPVTKEQVFDGAIAAPIVSLMATKALHHMTTPWMLQAGLPAKNGFGGAVFGVLPGVFGIAAVAPKLNPVGVSVKAAHALKYIMEKLQLSVYSSAKVEIVK